MTKYTKRTADEVLAAYSSGARKFWFSDMRGVDFTRVDLSGASFYSSILTNCNFDGAILTHAQLKACDLAESSFVEAWVNASDLIGASFVRGCLRGADLTGAALNGADMRETDLRFARLGNARLDSVSLGGARADGVYLSSTFLCDLDVSALCDARRVRHEGASYLEPRAVMKSYGHPGLKRFMIDCGTPEVFAEFMIECARSLAEPMLRSLMRSTFISYGGPDEKFARRLYNGLRRHGVVAFYFPESATPGERIDNEVFRQIQEHDRIILVCSRNSLDRPGVLNEIQETLDREARDGGATYLLPIMIDDYVLTEWKATQPVLAERVSRRVVSDFRKTSRSANFDLALSKLLVALRTKAP